MGQPVGANIPSVSVIIAAYNAEQVVLRAINSVLKQSYPALEIIIVNDASTDDTLSIINDAAAENPIITVYSLIENSGPSAARNTGILKARGDWVAMLDADDAWKPERLAKLINITAQREVNLLADNQLFYDSGLDREVSVGFSAVWSEKEITIHDLFLSDIRSSRTLSYGLLKLFINRLALIDSGVRYDESMRYAEDFYFLAELLFSGFKGIIVNDPLYIYTTRVGVRSGRRSPYSRSIPRFDLIVQAADRLRARYGTLIDPQVNRLIDKWRRRNELIHLSNIARDIRRSNRYVEYVVFLCGNGALLMFLMKNALARIARSRPLIRRNADSI